MGKHVWRHDIFLRTIAHTEIFLIHALWKEKKCFCLWSMMGLFLPRELHTMHIDTKLEEKQPRQLFEFSCISWKRHVFGNEREVGHQDNISKLWMTNRTRKRRRRMYLHRTHSWKCLFIHTNNNSFRIHDERGLFVSGCGIWDESSTFATGFFFSWTGGKGDLRILCTRQYCFLEFF